MRETSPFGERWQRGSVDGEGSSLEDIIELVIANENGVVLLHALCHQSVQNAALAQLTLEELQAFVVVHIAAGQNVFQPRGFHAPHMGFHALDLKTHGRWPWVRASCTREQTPAPAGYPSGGYTRGPAVPSRPAS